MDKDYLAGVKLAKNIGKTAQFLWIWFVFLIWAGICFLPLVAIYYIFAYFGPLWVLAWLFFVAATACAIVVNNDDGYGDNDKDA